MNVCCSSYYNAAVNVTLVYNTPEGKGKYDRKVELTVFGKVRRIFSKCHVSVALAHALPQCVCH